MIDEGCAIHNFIFFSIKKYKKLRNEKREKYCHPNEKGKVIEGVYDI